MTIIPLAQTIMHRLLFVLLMSFISLLSSSQDRILLMNGRRLEVRIVDHDPAKLVFEQAGRRGAMVTDSLATPEVFSFTLRDSTETVLYVKDEMLGDVLEVEEARYYIYGMADARKGYETWPTVVGGAVVGAAAPFVIGEGVLPVIVSTMGYGFGMQIPTIRVREETITDLNYKQYPTYLEGYNRRARNKKFKAAFLSALSGALVSSTAIALFGD